MRHRLSGNAVAHPEHFASDALELTVDGEKNAAGDSRDQGSSRTSAPKVMRGFSIKLACSMAADGPDADVTMHEAREEYKVARDSQLSGDCCRQE